MSYLDVIINGQNFSIVEKAEKPHSNFAAHTLSQIQYVIKNNLTYYSTTINDNYLELSAQERFAKLAEKSTVIRKRFMNKTNNLFF